jgi:hypothetical protein
VHCCAQGASAFTVDDAHFEYITIAASFELGRDQLWQIARVESVQVEFAGDGDFDRIIAGIGRIILRGHDCLTARLIVGRFGREVTAGTVAVGSVVMGCAGSSSNARLNSSSTPLVAFLISRMDLPRLRANSGSFLPPKRTNTITMTIRSSGPPMPSINARVWVLGVIMLDKELGEEIEGLASQRQIVR